MRVSREDVISIMYGRYADVLRLKESAIQSAETGKKLVETIAKGIKISIVTILISGLFAYVGRDYKLIIFIMSAIIASNVVHLVTFCKQIKDAINDTEKVLEMLELIAAREQVTGDKG